MDHNSTSWTEYAALWVSEPNGRGTWSILYSCVFTLSICVWSAIHLNIPPKGEDDSVQYWRKTKWVFIAIFAPELVLYSAWQQYYLARRFQMEMQNICREQFGRPPKDTRARWEKYIDRFMKFVGEKLDESRAAEEGKDKDGPRASEPVDQSGSPGGDIKAKEQDPDDLLEEMKPFSLRYGFFVVMGGFVIDVSDVYDDEKASWLTITPRGVINLARSLPWDQFKSRFRINEDAIRDKSKADCLAKILVFLQVLWAAVNSISRVVLNYPISVLEIHTLVHAGCAMLMYGLWFKKPLDIRDANEINTETFKDKLALMLVRSPGSAYRPYADLNLLKRYAPYMARQETQGSSIAWRDWPNPDYGSEAAFLCFDMNTLDYTPGFNIPIESTYLIVDTPDDFPSASKTDSDPPADRISEQDEYESGVGIDFKPSRTVTTVSRPAFVRRTPVRKVVKSKGDTGIERFHKKLKPRKEPRDVAQRLVSGEMLPSGIGPTCLITRRTRSTRMVRYEDYSKKASGHFAFLQRPIDWWFKPPEESVVEVSNHLKTLMPFPEDLYDYDDKNKRINLDRDQAYFHKMAFELSEKDVERWNRASAAFQAELKQASADHKSTPETQDDTIPEDTNEIRDAKPDETAHDNEKAETVEVHEESTLIQPDDALYQKTSKEEVEDVVAAQDDDETSRARGRSEDKRLEQRLRLLWSPNGASNATLFSGSDFCTRSLNLDFGAFGRLTDSEGSFAIAMFVVLSDISSIYAGIHLALWFHDFPTRAEALLWKISALTLGVPAPILVFATIFFSMFMARIPYLELKRNNKIFRACLKFLKRIGFKILAGFKILLKGIGKGFSYCFGFVKRVFQPLTTWLKVKYDASKREKGRLYHFCQTCLTIGRGIGLSLAGIAMALIFGPLIAAGVLYCFARVYIVVESFLSLRHVPVGVYEDVSFAQYIPHL